MVPSASMALAVIVVRAPAGSPPTDTVTGWSTSATCGDTDIDAWTLSWSPPRVHPAQPCDSHQQNDQHPELSYPPRFSVRSHRKDLSLQPANTAAIIAHRSSARPVEVIGQPNTEEVEFEPRPHPASSAEAGAVNAV
jgi:hypothetical protein